ncbi:MAG: hypothetical protein AB1476_03400 [Candidatus Hadarchaeota archaeon]
MATTIQVEERVRAKLEEIKMHPREPYSRVIERLITYCGEEGELSPETIKNIETALEDVKKGRTYSTKDAKRKLGIR